MIIQPIVNVAVKTDVGQTEVTNGAVVPMLLGLFSYNSPPSDCSSCQHLLRPSKVEDDIDLQHCIEVPLEAFCIFQLVLRRMLEVRVDQSLRQSSNGVVEVSMVAGPRVADQVPDVPLEGQQEVVLNNKGVHVLALMPQGGDGQRVVLPLSSPDSPVRTLRAWKGWDNANFSRIGWEEEAKDGSRKMFWSCRSSLLIYTRRGFLPILLSKEHLGKKAES